MTKNRLYAHANLDAKYGEPDNCHFALGGEKANLVTSVAVPQHNPHVVMHRPQLDLDITHSYKHSSTPGHGHLQLDVEVPWSKYVQWLELSAELGIVQEGWVEAAKGRGYTTLRLPHIKKTAAQKKASYPYGNPPPKVDFHAFDHLFKTSEPF